MPPEKAREDAYVQANFQRAEALRRIGRFADALVNYDKAAALRPDNMEIVYNRALAYSRLERLDAVIADLTRVVENRRRESYYVSALINRGLAYMRRNEFPKAVADLDRALSVEPGSPLALVRRGYIYEKAGQRDKAIADYRAALAAYAKMEEALEGLKRLEAN
jgi:tetratricopeptide (TPR) repeat protein